MRRKRQRGREVSSSPEPVSDREGDEEDDEEEEDPRQSLIVDKAIERGKRKRRKTKQGEDGGGVNGGAKLRQGEDARGRGTGKGAAAQDVGAAAAAATKPSEEEDKEKDGGAELSLLTPAVRYRASAPQREATPERVRARESLCFPIVFGTLTLK